MSIVVNTENRIKQTQYSKYQTKSNKISINERLSMEAKCWQKFYAHEE